MNFRALILYFSKTFTNLTLLGINITLHFFHILLASLCYTFTLYWLKLQPFLSVKIEVRYFWIHYCTKNFRELIKIVCKISTKSAQDSRKIHILTLKMQQLLGPQVGASLLVYRLCICTLNQKNKFVKMPIIFWKNISVKRKLSWVLV